MLIIFAVFHNKIQHVVTITSKQVPLSSLSHKFGYQGLGSMAEKALTASEALEAGGTADVS